MKVLFIGGTGKISIAASRLAISRGIDLYLLNRSSSGHVIPDAKLIQGDIRNPASVAEALKNHSFDVVVDWVGFTPKHIETDIELFRGKVGQYLFISSASVYQRPVSHYLITESTPLANPFWEYSREKIACEERLMLEYRTNGFPITIVRPSLTYGDTLVPAVTNSWNHPFTMIDAIRKGKKLVVPGDGTSLWTITHNTDFAKGIVGLLGHVQAIGHAFHITTDEVLTWDQIYLTIAKAAGGEAKIIHIPSDFIAAFSPESRGTLLGDKSVSVVFDNSKIKRFVPDFVATTTFAQGIQKSIDWLDAHPEAQSIDETWNCTLETIIAAYELGLSQAKRIS